MARYSRVAPNSTEIKWVGGTGMSARQVFKSYNKGHVNEFDQFVLDERVDKYSGTAAELIKANFNEATKGVSDLSTEAADKFIASLKGVMMEISVNGTVSGHFQGWEPNPEKPGFNKPSNDGKRATQATYDLVTLEIKDPAQFTIVG
ncbi:MAG: ester cyclase [Bacilli bacterium]|nr:ester cyclase [Bacilli bacterium]